jgi:hypothetical protein
VDTIECSSCHKNVIPHLWHYRPFPRNFRYPKTQHKCRLCGSLIFETGGKITPVGWIFGYVGLSVTAVIVAMVVPGSALINGAVNVAVLAFVGYAGYRFIKFIAKQLK